MSGPKSAQDWLVVIDMQVVFGEPDSPWFTPGYPPIEPTVARLVERFGDRVVFTRFVAPEHPRGVWLDYYKVWEFALVSPEERLYELMPTFAGSAAPVVTRTTFGKWDHELANIIGPDATMHLVGVSTDCCVLSTALPAADAGVRVKVIGDACAGVSEADHERALAAMALYGPLIELTTAADVLATRDA